MSIGITQIMMKEPQMFIFIMYQILVPSMAPLSFLIRSLAPPLISGPQHGLPSHFWSPVQPPLSFVAPAKLLLSFLVLSRTPISFLVPSITCPLTPGPQQDSPLIPGPQHGYSDFLYPAWFPSHYWSPA